MVLTKSDIKTRVDTIILEFMVNKDVRKMVLKLMELSADVGEEIHGPQGNGDGV